MKTLLVGCLLLAAAAAHGASQDEDFLAAREAFRSGNAKKLDLYARRLQGHILEPYVAYWQLRQRLEDAAPEEVQAYLLRYRDTPLSDRLRADWLKVLGKKQQWDLFDTEYPQIVNEDIELQCYALQARLRVSVTEALRAARSLWFTSRDLPENCTPLFNALAASHQLSGDDVWARIRLGLEAGNVGVARRVAGYLAAGQAPDGRVLEAIASNPTRYLDKRAFDLGSRAGRETVMFAVHRLARTSPQQAAWRWTRLEKQFSPEERAYVWGLVAYFGAMRHDSSALAWYARAGDLSDLQLAWKARAALRAGNWQEVLAAIDAMTSRESGEAAWRYWKARALRAQGRQEEANEILTPLAAEFNFYGQLATEELGGRIASPSPAFKPTREDVRAIGMLPGIQRALALYRLNLRFEGNREWLWAIRGFDDKQLLTAAEVARRYEVYDRAINTADKTLEVHDFNLRYLAPYRERMRDYIAQMQLDEAWVYGVIRQESRFIADAKSRAGASGLMQLMPATARWIARKLGLKDWRWSQVNEVDTNVTFGTFYLRHVLDALDNQPVLASAGYNAGPGRARAWRPGTPIEGAVYAETIPFNETRDYVKKVMANATYYAHVFSQQLQSLKQRLGVIAPRARDGETPLGDTP